MSKSGGSHPFGDDFLEFADSGSMFMQIVMWSFVPGVATSILQKMYYRVRYGGKKHSPPAGSPLFSKHYRFFYAAVIGTYLVYSLTSSYHNMPESLYDQLGASPTSSVAELKRSFRTMSLRYHPDKTDGNPELEKQFIIIRRAYDMLKDGRSRTYYDRMGSSMLSCQNCITERDFVTNGAMMALIFYLATGLALLLMTFVRRTTGQYWRWSVMLMVASVEIGVLTGSIADPMPGLLASRAPFEKIGFLHDVSFCIAILISQLHGVLFPSTERELAEVTDHNLLQMEEIVEQSLLLLDESTKPYQDEAGTLEGEVDRAIAALGLTTAANHSDGGSKHIPGRDMSEMLTATAGELPCTSSSSSSSSSESESELDDSEAEASDIRTTAKAKKASTAKTASKVKATEKTV